jgi:hypothetical protein
MSSVDIIGGLVLIGGFVAFAMFMASRSTPGSHQRDSFKSLGEVLEESARESFEQEKAEYAAELRKRELQEESVVLLRGIAQKLGVSPPSSNTDTEKKR